MNLLKVERYKNRRRVEFHLSFIVFLIPILVALSMKYTDLAYNIAYDKPGQISLFTLLITSLGMVSTMGLFHIIFAVIAANSTAYEIESRYYMMYFPKIKSKKQLLQAKQIVISESLLILFTLFLFIGSLSLKLIIVETDKLSTTFFDSYSFYFFCTSVAMFFEALLSVNFSLILGLFLRPLQVVLTTVALFFIQVLLADAPILKFIMPKYYLQNVLDYNDWTNNSGVIKTTLISVAVSICLLMIITYVGRRKIENELE